MTSYRTHDISGDTGVSDDDDGISDIVCDPVPHPRRLSAAAEEAAATAAAAVAANDTTNMAEVRKALEEVSDIVRSVFTVTGFSFAGRAVLLRAVGRLKKRT